MAQSLYRGLTSKGTNVLTDRPATGLTSVGSPERTPTPLPSAGDVYQQQTDEYEHAQTQKRHFTDWAIKRGASEQDIQEAIGLKGWDTVQRPAIPKVVEAKKPTGQWKTIKDPASSTGFSYQNMAVPSEIRREAPSPKKGVGAGGGAADKWNKDAAARLDKLYGTQTEMGIVVDPDRMAEYQDANTYLAEYKAQGLTANDAAVLASRRSVAGGVDPIQTVVDQQRALGKSDKEIKAMLRKSQFKSVSPRIYGLR